MHSGVDVFFLGSYLFNRCIDRTLIRAFIILRGWNASKLCSSPDLLYNTSLIIESASPPGVSFEAFEGQFIVFADFIFHLDLTSSRTSLKQDNFNFFYFFDITPIFDFQIVSHVHTHLLMSAKNWCVRFSNFASE